MESDDGVAASATIVGFREWFRIACRRQAFGALSPSDGACMRTLVIAGEYPWPENSGSRMRLAVTLRGLCRCGPTELFSIVPEGRTDFGPPDESLGLARVGRTAFDDRSPRGMRRLCTLMRPGTPFEFPWQDGPRVTRALTRFMNGHYDLIWYFGVRPWALVGGTEVAPVVLDLDDLENHKISARLSISRPAVPGLKGRLRQRVGRTLSAEEVRRWSRLHRRAGDRTTMTVVCSQIDADRAVATGLTRVDVVPNGYRLVVEPLGKVAVASPPTILFQGTLRYPPNADGARFLIEEIRPAMAAFVPDARIRLVGITTPAISALDDPPGVTIVGQVPDIDVELARADLVLVPIRFGSGTRLKIIEAFAQRIPVVSTTLGAEGLDAQNERHLLTADTPESIAAACARLLDDERLRARLADNAHRLFIERFQLDRVQDEIERIALKAAALSTAPSIPGPRPGGDPREGWSR
jgi:glycosyltransferase involved in cell wall biosynthesis